MKTTTLALAAAIAFTSSSVFAATANFQWAGVVPPAEELTPGLVIDNVGLTDHMNGVLEFANDGTTVKLIDATDMSFTVRTYTTEQTEADAKPAAYTYALKSTALSLGGLPEENNDWLLISADGAKPLVTGQVSDVNAAGAITKLTVIEEGTSPAVDQIEGQQVMVLAIVEVQPSII